MHLRAAFEFLGIARDCTAREARSAYLRLLKQHKPDRDPEGFKRLREAFEAVRAALEAAALPAMMPMAEVSGPDRDDDSSSETVPADLPADRSVHVGAALLDPTPADPFDLFLTRLRELEPDDHEGRLRIAQQAVCELPNHHEAYRLLAFLATQADRLEEARTVLRDGFARGSKECLGLLLRQHAPYLTGDELAAIGESTDPERLLLAALEHVRRGQIAMASQAALRAFEVAEEADAWLPATMAVRLSLELQVDGWLDQAETVTRRLEEWLDVHGSYKELDADAAVVWKLAGELSQLPREFPQALRTAIARGMLDGRMSEVSDAVSEYRTAQPHAAIEAAQLLLRAPTLTQFYHHLLSGSQPSGGAVSAQERWSSGGFGAMAFLVFSFGLITTMRSCGDRNHQARIDPPAQEQPAAQERLVELQVLGFSPELAAFAELCPGVDATIPTSGPRGYLCHEAVAILARLDASACSSASELLASFHGRVEKEVVRYEASDGSPSESADIGAMAPGDLAAHLRRVATELDALWENRCRRLPSAREP